MWQMPKISGAALILLLWAASPGLAQPGSGIPYSPPVSPYLNLTRPGNTASNYFNLVRPQFEFRNAYQSLQTQIGQNQSVVRETGGQLALPSTGHTTTFLNYSHYYPRLRGQAISQGTGNVLGRPPSLTGGTSRVPSLPRR